MQMRSGIDPMPSAGFLWHGLLHPLRLWLFRHHSRLLSPDAAVQLLRLQISESAHAPPNGAYDASPDCSVTFAAGNLIGGDRRRCPRKQFVTLRRPANDLFQILRKQIAGVNQALSLATHRVKVSRL